MTHPDIEDLRKLYEHGAPKVMTLIEWAEGLEKGLRDVIADLESPCSCHEGFTSRRMVDPQCFHHGVMSTVRIAEKALGGKSWSD